MKGLTSEFSLQDMIPSILENLSDEELKREAKNESKNDVISTIIRSCRCLLSRVPNQEEKMKEFEMFRLKMLLRLYLPYYSIGYS